MTVIAIDGPAGAGKSTVARAVADRLGLKYVDTGAMYRALALAALERGVSDPEGLERIARSVDLEADGERVLLDGVDVTRRIRDADVTAEVSKVAAHPGLRAALVPLQRTVAARGNVVMEGRDIGTAVLPDAPVKIFLTASLEERARRRAAETGATVEDVMAQIAARDRADAERSTSPLVKADDAIEIDTTGRSIEEIVEEVAALAAAVGGAIDG
jgi:CMP/dCMP kinase